MGEHIFKRHNKTLLLYHLVFPLKYRKSVITNDIGEGLKQICLDISERYEVHFIEIGHDGLYKSSSGLYIDYFSESNILN